VTGGSSKKASQCVGSPDHAGFAERGVHHRVVFIGSGKLGFADSALLAFCLGADRVNVAREAMMAIGCIQA
jgi:glutamate synthase domain-containing protein 2